MRRELVLTPKFNVVETPLACQSCGAAFSPHFYCPDARSPSRHIFVATVLHVDNAGALYAYCPQHTFTTYSLTADSKPRPKRTPLRTIARFFDSLIFRLALAIESWRLY